VWREYASHKSEPLPSPTDFDPETIDPETRSLLDLVYRRWGRYAAFTLRDMTHKDGPWKDTARDAEIDESAIQAYFTELLSGPASPAVHG
jgi:uncharacterized phage-associated protein